MSSPLIRIKRSAVAGKVPHYPSQIDLGEFAINIADGKVFIAAGTEGVGVGTTVIEVGISTENLLTGIVTSTTINTTNLTVTNQISGISSGAAKVNTATDAGNQWHHVGFLDQRTGYQKLKTNGLTYNPATGKLYAGIGSFHKVTGEVTASQLSVTGIATIGNVVVGGATTDLIVRGDARVTGVLTVGNSSLTFDGENDTVQVGTALTLGHTQGVQFHTQNLHAEGFEVNNINASGIITATSFVGSVTGNINSTGISTISGFRFPSEDGTEDQALVTDGAGGLSFKTLSGGGGSVGGATTISTSNTTATEGQTAFTAPNVFDDGSQATAFSVQVFVNGAKVRVGSASSSDYTLSAPQTINFASGLTVGDEVDIIVYFGNTLEEELFTATQDQTTFNLAGALAADKNYKVYLNGVKLRKGIDYNATASVVLVSAAAGGDEIDICSDQAEDQLTANEGQTAFAPSDSNTTEENMQVYLNGVRLRKTTDWSIGNPAITIINPATGLDAGDQLDVVVRRS